MLEIVCGFLDIGKKLERQLFALFVRLGKVYNFRALRLWHCGGLVWTLSSGRIQKSSEVAVSQNFGGDSWHINQLTAAANDP